MREHWWWVGPLSSVRLGDPEDTGACMPLCLPPVRVAAVRLSELNSEPLRHAGNAQQIRWPAKHSAYDRRFSFDFMLFFSRVIFFFFVTVTTAFKLLFFFLAFNPWPIMSTVRD